MNVNYKAETSVGFGTEGMEKVFFSEELSEYIVHASLYIFRVCDIQLEYTYVYIYIKLI